DAAAPLPAAAARRLRRWARRRAAREPLQLIVGTVGFRRLDLRVRPGVFVPRPETEVLAGEAIARTPAGGVVVEPCTGSGAVACAVAQEAGPARVVAIDSSPAAVALARANARRLGLAVEVRRGDLLDGAPRGLGGHVDVLVCNPPYLSWGEVGALEVEVREWDPPEALVGGPGGHETTDRLVAAAGAWLRPGGWLVVEAADTRAERTRRGCRSAGLADVRVLEDLTGRERIVCARLPGGR
ncbi:MAG: peptide chain release factor N(5)-glutamine methyltransferase, partial [Actinobacteria bacterium]|nr:peptide chain release factor N(5)-glutamine methyltransferase [Actinomycetota bacterium]